MQASRTTKFENLKGICPDCYGMIFRRANLAKLAQIRGKPDITFAKAQRQVNKSLQPFAYLKEAKRHSEPTVDAAAKALSRFEEYTRHRDFKAFHSQQAIAFKRQLAEQTGQRSREKLSKATLHTTLKQVKHVIQTMPRGNEIERRNRALVTFTLLTGARDSAIASKKLKHVDMKEGCIHQDAREVKKKFSKTFTTYFFPVGEEVKQIPGMDAVSTGRKSMGQ